MLIGLLEQESGSAGQDGRQHGIVIRKGGQKQPAPAFGTHRANCLDGIDAAAVWQSYVHQHDVGL